MKNNEKYNKFLIYHFLKYATGQANFQLPATL